MALASTSSRLTCGAPPLAIIAINMCVQRRVNRSLASAWTSDTRARSSFAALRFPRRFKTACSVTKPSLSSGDNSIARRAQRSASARRARSLCANNASANADHPWAHSGSMLAA